MKRVQLVVTGQCEQRGLHRSLARLFPASEWPSPKKADSFTSTPLVEPPPSGVRATLDKFADWLLGALDETDDDTLVVAVDDLELDGDRTKTTRAVSDAVLRAIADPRWSSSRARAERLERAVARRCSFHLLVPMVEAYFFPDVSALERAGARRPSLFDARQHDHEDFTVRDEAFLHPPDSADKHDWCRGGAQRARHPKRYLKFLTGDGTPGNWVYREGKHGAAALEALDWSRVLATPTFSRGARALINDVADFLGEAPQPGEVEASSPGVFRNC
jgi:hypothetical protein